MHRTRALVSRARPFSLTAPPLPLFLPQLIVERARLGAEQAELELADANAHAELELARAKVAAVTVERARRESTIQAALGRALRGSAGPRRTLRLAWQRWGAWTRGSARMVALACDAFHVLERHAAKGDLRAAASAWRRWLHAVLAATHCVAPKRRTSSPRAKAR